VYWYTKDYPHKGELDEGGMEGGAELAVDAQDFFTEAELDIGRTARYLQMQNPNIVMVRFSVLRIRILALINNYISTFLVCVKVI
jgi:hypothetical protein